MQYLTKHVKRLCMELHENALLLPDTQNTEKSTSCNKKASWFNSKRLLLVSQIYHNQEHRKYHLKGVYLSNQMCYCIMSILLTVVRL